LRSLHIVLYTPAVINTPRLIEHDLATWRDHLKRLALEPLLELGNKDGLQRSYGNQALILKDWGWRGKHRIPDSLVFGGWGRGEWGTGNPKPFEVTAILD
jgi:hypothetical protein